MVCTHLYTSLLINLAMVNNWDVMCRKILDEMVLRHGSMACISCVSIIIILHTAVLQFYCNR